MERSKDLDLTVSLLYYKPIAAGGRLAVTILVHAAHLALVSQQRRTACPLIDMLGAEVVSVAHGDRDCGVGKAAEVSGLHWSAVHHGAGRECGSDAASASAR